MIALTLLALVPLFIALGERAARLILPAAKNSKTGKAHTTRALTYAGIALAVVIYPLLIGDKIHRYYGQFFPIGNTRIQFWIGLAAAGLYLALLHLVWIVTDNIRLRVRRAPRRIVRRFVTLPLAAIGVAALEELLFRAMLLADLLRYLHPGPAVVIGALVFAGAHYIREVKRYWTFPGHFGLGLLLCVALLKTGSLWLPVGLHAGGILIIMGVRPFIRYYAPHGVTGASIYPYAGITGIIALSLLTLNIWLGHAWPK